jgi:DNA polymerase III alpha subunit
VNKSHYLTDISGNTIYIGFIHLKSFEKKIGEAIPLERERNGPYKNFEDFLQRIPAGLEQTNILIRIGALRFTGKSKRTLLWQTHFYYNKAKRKNGVKAIFENTMRKFDFPELEKDPLEDAYDELELLGFPLCNPFLLMDKKYEHDTTARQLRNKINHHVTMTGYLVTTKNTRTVDHKLMHFGTFLDEEGAIFDTTHFPDTAKRYPFRGSGLYLIKGKVAEDFGYPMVEVTYMIKLPMVKKTSRNPKVLP